jgi:hypothetical protein
MRALLQQKQGPLLSLKARPLDSFGTRCESGLPHPTLPTVARGSPSQRKKYATPSKTLSYQKRSNSTFVTAISLCISAHDLIGTSRSVPGSGGGGNVPSVPAIDEAILIFAPSFVSSKCMRRFDGYQA